MSNLSRTIFDAPVVLDHEMAEVPEWGVTLKLLEPTAEKRAALLQQFVDAREQGSEMDLATFYPAVIIATAVDPTDDSPVFGEADAGRINALNGLVVERVATAAMRIAGLDEEAADAPKAPSSTSLPSEGSTDSLST